MLVFGSMKVFFTSVFILLFHICLHGTSDTEISLTCLAADETLNIAPGEWLEIPFEIRTREGEGAFLQIRQWTFYSDTRIRHLIAGARLRICGENEEVLHPTTFNDSLIRFYKNSGICRLENAEQLKVVLEIQAYRQMLPDKESLQLYMNKNSFTYAGGSERIPVENIGDVPMIRTGVQAVDCRILHHGSLWEHPFRLELGNCDAYYNISKGSSSTYSIRARNSKEEIIREIQGSVSGQKSIDLALPEKDSYTVCLNENDSILISGFTPHCIYNETFNRMPEEWTGKENWKISEGRLQNNMDNVSGSSLFVCKEPFLIRGNRNIEWEGTLSLTGEWVASSVNYFRYYLFVDDPVGSHRKALYFGVNATNKESMLLADVMGKKDTIWQGGKHWLEGSCYRFRICYTADGEWKIYMAEGEDLPLLIGKISNHPLTAFFDTPLYSGLLFRHQTASRGGKLWVDGIKMCEVVGKFNSTTIRAIGDHCIELMFPFSMNVSDLLDPTHFSLKQGGMLQSIDSLQGINSEVVRIFCKLESREYTLEIASLRDAESNRLPPERLSFRHISEARPGDIVCNEILFKPGKEEGFTGPEYVELFNTQDYDVRLDSAAFIDRGKIRDYITDTLRAKSYLLLGGTAAMDALSKYGKGYRIKNFSLVNDSALLALTSKQHGTLDSVHYKSYWIRDKKKRLTGGYALEKIEAEVSSSAPLNWHESIAPEGGTPGKRNSVADHCPDTEAPYIVQHSYDKREISLVFNENIYTPSATEITHYTLDHNCGYPESIEANDERIKLCFRENFIPNREYKLSVRNVTDLCGNPIPHTILSFFIAPEAESGDVLINELLYEASPTEAEYIELYNRSNKRLRLEHIQLGKKSNKGELRELKAITDSLIYFEPQSYIWICYQPEVIQNSFYYHNPENCFVTSSKLAYSDQGGTVIVRNKNNGALLDELVYGKFLHHPNIQQTKNVALERTSHSGTTNSSNSWTSAFGYAGEGYGSPGMANRSAYREGNENGSSGMERLPEVFTPNGDGFEDRVEIRVTLDQQDFSLYLDVYRANGSLVKKLANGTPIHHSGTLEWDGRDNNGRLMPTGIYILYAKTIRPDGKYRTFRKTCVLSR